MKKETDMDVTTFSSWVGIVLTLIYRGFLYLNRSSHTEIDISIIHFTIIDCSKLTITPGCYCFCHCHLADNQTIVPM